MQNSTLPFSPGCNQRANDQRRDILVAVKTNGRIASALRAQSVAGPNEPDTAKLARCIAAYAPHDGSFELRIPGLHASRFSRINRECVHALRAPSLCIVAQGAKTVMVGDEVYEYDESRMIVFSVALPVAAQITQASHSEPYLAVKLDLDPHKIAELVLKVYAHGPPPVQERSAVYITPVDASIVNAATRLMECLAHPGDAELLAPLVMDEILIRLLRSPIGVRVAQMGFAESSVHRVAKAISYIHEAYMATWRELERLVQDGLVRHIGTSNMTIPKLKLLLRDAAMRPAVNEMELHPHFQQAKLLEFVAGNGIIPVGYSPLGSPSRPQRDRTPEDTVDMEDPVVLDISRRTGLTPAGVCLRWGLQRWNAVIPFSVKRSQYLDSLRATVARPLSDVDMSALGRI